VWFAAALVIWACFLRCWTVLQTTSLIGTLAIIGFAGYNNSIWALYEKSQIYDVQMWSPYYKVPMSRFLALPGWEKVTVTCVVIFVPIFFAGVVFGTLFGDSLQPDVDFGSNVAEAIAGSANRFRW
jgi:hypothetical protein